jgi:hypothetical protein
LCVGSVRRRRPASRPSKRWQLRMSWCHRLLLFPSPAALSAAGMELLKRLLVRSPDSDNDNGFCHS